MLYQDRVTWLQAEKRIVQHAIHDIHRRKLLQLQKNIHSTPVLVT